MALADELKTLEDLHEKGKLTDQEFADAKAATLNRQEPAWQEPISAGPERSRAWMAVPVLILLLVLVAVFWYTPETKNVTQMIATAVHAPITLKNEVENVTAASWQAVPLNVTYAGTVDVSLQVVNGNPIDVFLMTPDQLEKIKKADWINVQVYGDFGATKTKTYSRSARLDQGIYYLVLRDTSLGILSARASDISVKAQLKP